MKWNDHSNIPEGAHAFLGASKYHWLNYDDEKVSVSYRNHLAVQRGTMLHEFAATCIILGQRLPKSKKTLNAYVNDAIGFRMTPEQLLYFSDNCFGTADAIAFDEKRGYLRIHDLKTGVTPASLHQLEIYAALFCLEYEVKPEEIEMQLRIYQNDDVLIGEPTGIDIRPIMSKIRHFDKIIDGIKNGG